MNVSVIGSGYVGLTLAACLADLGHSLTIVDIDKAKVTTINNGQSPIHERRLNNILASHVGTNLQATMDYGVIADTDVTFIAVSTPTNADGTIDTTAIESALTSLGEIITKKMISTYSLSRVLFFRV